MLPLDMGPGAKLTEEGHLYSLPTYQDLETLLEFAVEENPRFRRIADLVKQNVESGNITLQGALDFFLGRLAQASAEEIQQIDQSLIWAHESPKLDL